MLLLLDEFFFFFFFFFFFLISVFIENHSLSPPLPMPSRTNHPIRILVHLHLHLSRPQIFLWFLFSWTYSLRYAAAKRGFNSSIIDKPFRFVRFVLNRFDFNVFLKPVNKIRFSFIMSSISHLKKRGIYNVPRELSA